MYKKKDRRYFKRYSGNIPVEFKSQDSDLCGKSFTLNVTDRGALLLSNELIKKGTKLVLKINLKDKTFNIDSQVIHVEEEKKGGPYHIGIEFLQRSTHFAKKLYDTIEDIIEYRNRISKEQNRKISFEEASLMLHKTRQKENK